MYSYNFTRIRIMLTFFSFFHLPLVLFSAARWPLSLLSSMRWLRNDKDVAARQMFFTKSSDKQIHDNNGDEVKYHLLYLFMSLDCIECFVSVFIKCTFINESLLISLNCHVWLGMCCNIKLFHFERTLFVGWVTNIM